MNNIRRTQLLSFKPLLCEILDDDECIHPSVASSPTLTRSPYSEHNSSANEADDEKQSQSSRVASPRFSTANSESGSGIGTSIGLSLIGTPFRSSSARQSSFAGSPDSSSAGGYGGAQTPTNDSQPAAETGNYRMNSSGKPLPCTAMSYSRSLNKPWYKKLFGFGRSKCEFINLKKLIWFYWRSHHLPPAPILLLFIGMFSLIF